MHYKPAIVIVAYNRRNTLERLLSYINQAHYPDENVNLIISIDYCEDNQDVINSAEKFQWKHGTKTVKTHTQNMGLKAHILECGDYALEYGAVIILEDDLVVAPAYYEFVQDAQNFYYNDNNIAGVSLYSHEWNGYAHKKFTPIVKDGDVFFGQFSCTWGQSWTDKQWKNFQEWYNKCPKLTRDGRMPERIYTWKHSWGKYYTAYITETNKFYVIPYKPMSSVFGEVGVHAKLRSLEHQVSLYLGNKKLEMVEFEQGVHYDIFFENIDLKQKIKQKFIVDDVCIDIYAHRRLEFINSRYLLSTRKLDKKIIKAFALDMRPQEMNVFFDVEGQDIFLYDMSVDEKNMVYKKKGRIFYDLTGVRPRTALFYAICYGLEERINARRK